VAFGFPLCLIAPNFCFHHYYHHACSYIDISSHAEEGYFITSLIFRISKACIDYLNEGRLSCASSAPRMPTSKPLILLYRNHPSQVQMAPKQPHPLLHLL
jgi:hypothetical protein